MLNVNTKMFAPDEALSASIEVRFALSSAAKGGYHVTRSGTSIRVPQNPGTGAYAFRGGRGDNAKDKGC